MAKEIIGEASNYQRIWESLIFPKGYHLGGQLSVDPLIFFVITGCVSFKMNGREVYTILPQEMFLAQYDNLYEITMMEQTHLIICHVPIEAWYKEQKWIERLISENNAFFSGDFFKLPVKKMIVRYLSLLDLFLKEGSHSPDFFELKREELFFLFFHYYSKDELAQFLQPILSSDIQFKNLVINNYLHAKDVQGLAKLANYSTSGFIKKFQRCFSDSPYRWMQKQKAKQIFVEIYRGNKSLQEISNEYNFSSYQHFSIFCKIQLGATPTMIMEKSRINNE